jgi:hypothetical protein
MPRREFEHRISRYCETKEIQLSPFINAVIKTNDTCEMMCLQGISADIFSIFPLARLVNFHEITYS